MLNLPWGKAETTIKEEPSLSCFYRPLKKKYNVLKKEPAQRKLFSGFFYFLQTRTRINYTYT